MEANELMVGDWVRFKSDSEVTKIDAYGLCNWVLSNIEPIPLTAEILEKNGWILVENEYRSPEDIAYKESLRLQIGEDGNAFWWIVGYVIITPINYVHELQHALRICGLKDVADDFKI